MVAFPFVLAFPFVRFPGDHPEVHTGIFPMQVHTDLKELSNKLDATNDELTNKLDATNNKLDEQAVVQAGT
jgi:hypothetical protein